MNFSSIYFKVKGHHLDTVGVWEETLIDELLGDFRQVKSRHINTVSVWETTIDELLGDIVQGQMPFIVLLGPHYCNITILNNFECKKRQCILVTAPNVL